MSIARSSPCSQRKQAATCLTTSPALDDATIADAVAAAVLPADTAAA